MIERFNGDENKRTLISELCNQTIVLGDSGLASALADVAELKEMNKGDVLIKQDDEDTDVYFIITGQFEINANGRPIAERNAGTHIGEMALIDTKAIRSATVIAISKSVVAKVSETDFSRVANDYPDLWRRISIELCERLRNRNKFIRRPNKVSRVFICSSSESLNYAEAIRLQLEHHHSDVTLWTDQVFNPMTHTMEDLEREVSAADFGIALVMPEDAVNSRNMETMSPRDNVVFELGLFMGRLGRKRTLIVKPRGVDIKIPSDLVGLNSLEFKIPENSKDSSEMARCLGSICTQLKSLIDEQGAR